MFNLFKPDTSQSLEKELLKDYINESKIQKIIDSGININTKDEKGKTILFKLCQKRRIEAIKVLIKNGIEIDAEDNHGNTVLFEAASNSDGMMIRFLLSNGASINYVNSSGRTIIQDVALEGNHKIFQILLSHGADLNYRDNYGKTVLFDAVEGGDIDIVKEILNNIDDIDIVDKNNESALFYAILKDNQTIAQHLIDYGLDVNILNKDRRNVLFKAILLGDFHLDTIDMLIDSGIDLNIKDMSGKTILDEILKIISIIDEEDPDKYKLTDYRYVNAEYNYLKLTTILIDAGLMVDRRDNFGKTPLFYEVDKQNTKNINFLISSGADINAEDKDGKTLLFQECIKGFSNISMIDFLIEKGIDINHKDKDERTILEDLCEMVLIEENDIRVPSRKFLDIRENGNYIKLLKRIIGRKPKLNLPRNNGRTILFDIINYNNLDLIKLFLHNGADTNVIDNDGNSPLSLMIDNGLKLKKLNEREKFLERVVFMLKFRLDVNAVDKDGRTVYHKAVIANDIELIEKLLTKKADLNIRDKQGRTALHHTQWKGNYKIARLLIAAGADMNIPDYAGFTILNYAAILGHTRLVVVLLASGVLMYNKAKKSKTIAKFFKEKEANLNKLLENNITDEKMKSAINQVVENLKKEVNQAIK